MRLAPRQRLCHSWQSAMSLPPLHSRRSPKYIAGRIEARAGIAYAPLKMFTRRFWLRAVQVLCVDGCQPAERTQNSPLRGSPSLVTGIWRMSCTMRGAAYTYATAAATAAASADASAAASACRKDLCMHV